VIATTLIGLFYGFVMAATVGPIWIFGFRTGVNFGFKPAIGVGVGAAIVDTIYSFLGALGAAALLTNPGTQRFISLVGAIIVGWLGVRTLISHRKPVDVTGAELDLPTGDTFQKTLKISLIATATNPLTILGWVAILTATGNIASGISLKLAFAISIGFGSLFAFLIVSLLASKIGARLSPSWLRKIDLISAIAFFGFAIALAIRGVK
jgi:threonine/homoserine/homoserine lactone efflux protein